MEGCWQFGCWELGGCILNSLGAGSLVAVY